MRLWKIEYVGREYVYDFPREARDILTFNHNLFTSLFTAETYCDKFCRPLDKSAGRFWNYHIEQHQMTPWSIRELSMIEIINEMIGTLSEDSQYASPPWAIHDEERTVFLDRETPSMVSYWDGRRIVQMKPGRYLARFHKHLNKVQVEYYSKWWMDGQRPPIITDGTVRFMMTEEEMIDAYARGPESCMEGKKAPRVYAGGDFAIAILEASSGDVSARVLVNTKTKVFGRIYPEDGDLDKQMEQALRALDYTSLEETEDGFEGAHFLQIEVEADEYGEEPSGNTIAMAMPYLDRGVYVDPETWTATRKFDRYSTLDSSSTNGVMYLYGDKCKVCGKLAMIQNDRHRVDHEDFGRRVALCPEHRRTEKFTDAWNGDIRYGHPTYTTTDGKTYSRYTIESNLYVSDHSGDWALEFEEPKIMVDGRFIKQSEAKAYGARYDERYFKWTRKSEEEVRAEHEIVRIKQRSTAEFWSAFDNERYFTNIEDRRTYGRPLVDRDDQIQETSRVSDGGDIYRTIPAPIVGFGQQIPRVIRRSNRYP